MNDLKDKSFALIGVNIFKHEPGELKEVMTREKLNWRSFADDGSIANEWNAPATPAFYIIDHLGTIRNKWTGGHPGEKTIDAVLERLIREAEAAGAK